MSVTIHFCSSARLGRLLANASLAYQGSLPRSCLCLRRFAYVVLTAFLLGGVLLVTPKMAWSQASSATFQGQLTDPAGSLIPGATVTLTKEDTQTTTTKTTSSTGNFAFTFVPPGVYTLKIEADGFKVSVSTGITLTAGQQVRQTFNLELGQVTESVTVEGAAPLVNTVSAQQLQTYSLMDARELPLLNRNFTGLLKLSAGVVPSTGESGTGVNLNGIGRNGTSYSLDGTNASGNTGSNNPGVYQGGNLIDVMSVEGIADVNVVKGAIPAEFANGLGGQVNLVSKSGTNEWHGSLFANHKNSALAARYQPSATKPGSSPDRVGGLS